MKSVLDAWFPSKFCWIDNTVYTGDLSAGKPLAHQKKNNTAVSLLLIFNVQDSRIELHQV